MEEAFARDFLLGIISSVPHQACPHQALHLLRDRIELPLERHLKDLARNFLFRCAPLDRQLFSCLASPVTRTCAVPV